MSSCRCRCDDDIRSEAARLGAYRCGFARAQEIDGEADELYHRWIGHGNHGDMKYLDRYHEVRRDPRLLLDGAATVIVCAFNYFPPVEQPGHLPQIARYALGRDYHEVVRSRLEALASFIKQHYGGETRAVVDTAPIRERWWAVKAGIGFIGLNNQLIIPDAGSHFFLGEILWTGLAGPDSPCTLSCGNCGRCVKACPTHALDGKGGLDARRCLSYLTIEYRGDIPDDIDIGNHLYGCDECQKVCPHNKNATPTDIPDFSPTPELLSLDIEKISVMTQDTFSSIFRHSAVKRTKLAGLLRNAARLTKDAGDGKGGR